MTPVVQFFFALGLMIAFAKAAGYVSYRLNQPAVLGELLAGVILGPTVLNLLGNVALFPDGAHVQSTIIEVAELGVLLLMFMAGLEVDPKSLRAVGKPALYAGVLGVIVPLVIIAPATTFFGYPIEKGLFMGILFASMSTSITAQVMLELGVLRRREGVTLLGAALIDDAVVIVLLSLFVAINPGNIIVLDSGANVRSIGEVFLRLIGFLTVGFGFAWVVLPRALNFVSKLRISEGALTFALVATLLMSFAAEYIGGIAAITGAFMAGFAIRQANNRVVEQIERGLHALNYAFLVPLFFVSIGLQSNLRLLTAELLPFALVITALAIVTKVLGAGGGVRLAGDSPLMAKRIGLGMISRGEVGLIIASIGVNYAILTPETFTVAVFVVLVTTIITPPLVRWSFNKDEPDAPATGAPPPTPALEATQE